MVASGIHEKFGGFMHFPHYAALVLASLIFASGAHCEAPVIKGVGGPGAGLATRSVSTYLGLERSLEDAISRGDKEAASGLLAERFEFSAGRQGAVGRQEWLNRELLAGRQPGLVRDLNVRESPGVAVVSFLLDYRREDGKGAVYSITDVWNSVTRQLQSRRAAEMNAPPPQLHRPTGRE